MAPNWLPPLLSYVLVIALGIGIFIGLDKLGLLDKILNRIK